MLRLALALPALATAAVQAQVALGAAPLTQEQICAFCIARYHDRNGHHEILVERLSRAGD
ncbi:MAG: hypothetical protein HYY97_08880 [Rhodocyclales bacterium]|nr:hypothetical protein [Rhodocyclales bacterium]